MNHFNNCLASSFATASAVSAYFQRQARIETPILRAEQNSNSRRTAAERIVQRVTAHLLRCIQGLTLLDCLINQADPVFFSKKYYLIAILPHRAYESSQMIYGNRLGHSDSILVSPDIAPLSMQKVGPSKLPGDMFREEARGR